ncbi:MAG: DUF1579 family protein [Steroidobacteraceae bacterium]
MAAARSAAAPAAAATASAAPPAATPAPAAAAQPPVDRYLKALAGPWTMRGTLMGQPVQYRAEGRWVLDNGFLQLDMVDVAEPPQYRASVFIGFDREHTDYVVHWLDNSGAAGARVVGTGRLKGRTLTLDFPYADGVFRDELYVDEDAVSGSLAIDAREPDGSWKPFARYTLERPGLRRAPRPPPSPPATPGPRAQVPGNPNT